MRITIHTVHRVIHSLNPKKQACLSLIHSWSGLHIPLRMKIIPCIRGFAKPPRDGGFPQSFFMAEAAHMQAPPVHMQLS